MLLQMALHFSIGIGSAYSVQKHGFLATTVLVAISAAVVGEWGNWARGDAVRTPMILGAPFAGAILALLVVRYPAGLDLQRAVKYETDIRDFMGKVENSRFAGQTLSFNQDLDLSLNFAITTVHLNPTPELALDQIDTLVQVKWPAAVRAAFVVVGTFDRSPDRLRCEAAAERSTFRIISRDCYGRPTDR